MCLIDERHRCWTKCMTLEGVALAHGDIMMVREARRVGVDALAGHAHTGNSRGSASATYILILRLAHWLSPFPQLGDD